MGVGVTILAMLQQSHGFHFQTNSKKFAFISSDFSLIYFNTHGCEYDRGGRYFATTKSVRELGHYLMLKQ